MSINEINNIRDRVKNKATTFSDVEAIVDVARELGCIADLIGRDYEIRDSTGKLIYTIRQKPMKVVQLNVLSRALNSLREKEKKQLPKGKGRKK